MALNDEYISKQLETTEDRLNDHAERIRTLEKGVAVTDAKVDTLCASLEKQTKSINALIGTASVMGAVDWKLVASASVLAGILSIATSVAGLPECEECKEE